MHETASFVLLMKFFALRNKIGALLLKIAIFKNFGKKMKNIFFQNKKDNYNKILLLILLKIMEKSNKIK